MLVDLDNKLTQQDIHNATKLLVRKSNKLRERLTAAKEMLEKIGNCGEEMDGNTSTNEEEDFVEMLKDQMPEILGNIDENFKQIDAIDQLINQLTESKDIDQMQQCKKDIENAADNVEQNENLVQKLERAIIEWNALRKLCMRDCELENIQLSLEALKESMRVEVDIMNNAMKKL